MNSKTESLFEFCKKCTFLSDLKEDNKRCGDLCCHDKSDALETSSDGQAYKLKLLLNYNSRKYDTRRNN
jgi:hypothetical protein